MNSKFIITHKLDSCQKKWTPYAGSLELSLLASFDDIMTNNKRLSQSLFELKVDGKEIDIICDSSSMKKENKTEDGFINFIYEGKCYLKNNIKNQFKVTVAFGDYPNTNAKFVVFLEDKTCPFIESAIYFLKLTR